MPEHKGGKQGRKFGRNKIKCNRYRLEGRREKNKVKRADRDLKRVARLQALKLKRAKAA